MTMRAPLLGCIGDDFTGSTDLANTLVRRGMRSVQLIGVPSQAKRVDADAIVIALKSRSIPARDAVAQSLQALAWLQAAGCRQFFFKYCSTFDSTDAGNIGPVADALLDAVAADFALACPAFPENGRSVYKGHLFVGDKLLNESGMEHHPLTPMTDANLVRVLARQVKAKVGLVPYEIVARGARAISDAFQRLRTDGARFAIVDAIADADLHAIGEAAADLPLITGGSGVAIGLPENFRRRGLLQATDTADALPRVEGFSAVLSGSCSAATQGQVQEMGKTRAAFKIDLAAHAGGSNQVDAALDWALPKLANGPVLLYTTDTPDAVKAMQTKLGRETAGRLGEKLLAEIAVRLVDAGVRRLVVAGGETSGAVVNALGIRGLRIGPQIDPGVPWTATLDEPALAVALKSGNFGTPDFFLKAFDRLP
jgi:uncharacterized protein YgbK (DUF1537 family)